MTTTTAPRRVLLGRRNPKCAPCSPHQRLYLRVLMQQLELDTLRLTLMHRRFFEDAKVQFPGAGTDVEHVLSSLSMADASALIRAMKAEVGDED